MSTWRTNVELDQMPAGIINRFTSKFDFNGMHEPRKITIPLTKMLQRKGATIYNIRVRPGGAKFSQNYGVKITQK